MSTRGCISSVISLFLNLSIKYDKIAKDEERKATTKYFGVYAISTTVIAGAIFVLVLWGIIACINAIDSSGLSAIVLYIIIGILGLIELTLFGEIILGGLMGIVYQFRCNRQPIGYIALIVFVITVISMGVGIILIIGRML